MLENKIGDKFLMLKIKEIKNSLHAIENIENLSKKIEDIEESFFKLNKYYDDLEYKGIRDIRDLFDEVDGVGYYKPKKSNNIAFNGNFIEYESKGGKYKSLSEKEYLDMIRPHLRDIINDHKAPMRLKVHSRDKVIDYETQFGEWKIQLTMEINFISSKDSEETRTWHAKSNNREIMMGSETDNIINELIDSLLQRY